MSSSCQANSCWLLAQHGQRGGQALDLALTPWSHFLWSFTGWPSCFSTIKHGFIILIGMGIYLGPIRLHGVSRLGCRYNGKWQDLTGGDITQTGDVISRWFRNWHIYTHLNSTTCCTRSLIFECTHRHKHILFLLLSQDIRAGWYQFPSSVIENECNLVSRLQFSMVDTVQCHALSSWHSEATGYVMCYLPDSTLSMEVSLGQQGWRGCGRSII